MQEFLNKYKGVVDRADKKLKELDKDVVITNSIIFTNKTDFYYLFKIYQNKKCIQKIKAVNNKEYDKIFADLTNKYGTNIILDYTDLNSSQLNYLNDIDTDNRINKDEVFSEIWQRPLI